MMLRRLMRSPRGFAASIVFLLLVPLALVYLAVVGAGVDIAMHAALALGSALMAFAVFDFSTARWIAWIGAASIGGLAVVFALQGLSELVQSAPLTYLVFQVLGQRLEGWLVDVFLLWCVAVLLVDSHGKTRVLGMIAMAIAVSVEAYANGLSFFGSSLNVEAPILKVLVLLPFAWLLLESRKASWKVAVTRQ
jgi:hypothetical protein